MRLRPAFLAVVLATTSPACSFLFPFASDEERSKDAAAETDAETDQRDGGADAGLDGGLRPAAPEPLFPWNGYRAGHRMGGTTVRFVWRQLGMADGFQVRIAKRCHDGTSREACLDTTGVEHDSVGQMTIDVLLEDPRAIPVGARYDWQVRAHGVGGWSDWSAPRTFETRAEGDFDGDGFPDPAAGAPNRVGEGDPLGAGWSYVLDGGGLPALLDSLHLGNPLFLGHFGSAVASAGDLDGDGFADIAISAPSEPTNDVEPLVLLKWGGDGDQLLGDSDRIYDPTPAAKVTRFGTVVAGIGDFDADELDDLAIGAPWTTGALPRAGVVYLYFGRAGQEYGDPSNTLRSPNEASMGEFGSSIARAGDMNVDGWADLLVVAPGETTGDRRVGRVYLCTGGPARADQPCTEIDIPRLPGSPISAVAGLGDVDGDAVADAAVLGGGVVYVLRGGNLGSLPLEIRSAGVSTVAAAGDLDGDRFADVALGFPDNADPLICWGGTELAGCAESATIPSPGEGGFGSVLAGVGDVNGDGRDELAVGAPSAPVGNTLAAGVLRIYSFGSDRVPGDPVTVDLGADAHQGDGLSSAIAAYEP